MFGGAGALLAVLACVGLACGALWLVQGAFNSVRQLAPSGSSATSTPPGEAPLGSGDGGEFVSIPLESGLPRTVTYSGLSYTVLEAVLENQPGALAPLKDLVDGYLELRALPPGRRSWGEWPREHPRRAEARHLMDTVIDRLRRRVQGPELAPSPPPEGRGDEPTP